MFLVRRVSKRGCKLYRYSSRREGGRVVKQYEGVATALDAERLEALRRQEEQAREQRRRECEPSDVERQLAARLASDRRAVAAALEAAGFRSVEWHWRSRRIGRPPRPRAR
jgi:hypothetical protein